MAYSHKSLQLNAVSISRVWGSVRVWKEDNGTDTFQQLAAVWEKWCVKAPQNVFACQWVHGECQLRPPAAGLESSTPTSSPARLKSRRTSRRVCGTLTR